MRKRFVIVLALLIILSLSACIKKTDDNSQVNLYPAFEIVDRAKVWGFIDDSGEFVIGPKYDGVFEFSKYGIAQVYTKNSFGAINEKGEEVITLKYRDIMDIEEGYLSANDGEAYHVFNHKGELQFTTDEYLFIGPYSDGLFVTAKTDDNNNLLMGHIDKSGKPVTELKYMRAYDFINGVAIVMVEEDSYQLIDKKGKVLKELDYTLVVPSEDEEMYLVKDKNNEYGYLDKNGDLLIWPKYSYGKIFEEGGAIIGINNDGSLDYGVIDIIGEYIIEPEYSHIISLGKGYYGVSKEKDNNGYKYAIANSKGEFVTDFLYYEIGGKDGKINNDLIVVFDGKETYALELNGKKKNKSPVLEGKGEINIYNKVTRTNLLDRLSYYNAKGNLVWRESNDYSLNKNTMTIEKQYTDKDIVNIYYPAVEGLKNKEVEKKINNEIYKRFVTDAKEVTEDNSKKYDYYNTTYILRKFHDLLTIEKHSEFLIEGELIKDDEGAVYNISLRTGEFFTLEDLFQKGADYKTVLTNIVREQMGMDIMQGVEVYKMGEYDGIREDQDFIVQLDAIEIFFSPKEIRSNNRTYPIFSIEQQSLSHILDMESEFWWTYTVNRGF